MTTLEETVKTSAAEGVALTRTASSVRLRPLFEGNNISYAIGFKHINYVTEAAVLQHFRDAGLPAGELYTKYGLGFEIVSLKSRLGALLAVDDEVEAEVVPARSADALTFKVDQHVERDGERIRTAASTVQVVLRIQADAAPTAPIPDELLPFTTARIGPGKRIPLEVTPAPYPGLHSGRGTTGPQDPVLAQLIGTENAFGWRWRVPYFYCHFNERLQMSGLLRVMEETEDLFLADRGLPIKAVLDTRRWIPVVTQSRINLLDETIMEEELYTIYTVEDIFKDLLYTSRMDCYVIRDGALVRTATGSITHGYLHEHAPNQWQMATLDSSAVAALSSPTRAVR